MCRSEQKLFLKLEISYEGLYVGSRKSKIKQFLLEEFEPTFMIYAGFKAHT